jgi:hypothetical protein
MAQIEKLAKQRKPRDATIKKLLEDNRFIDVTINFELLPPLSATPTIMIICTKIVFFLIVGETDDSPNKLRFCWWHNKRESVLFPTLLIPVLPTYLPTTGEKAVDLRRNHSCVT